MREVDEGVNMRREIWSKLRSEEMVSEREREGRTEDCLCVTSLDYVFGLKKLSFSLSSWGALSRLDSKDCHVRSAGAPYSINQEMFSRGKNVQQTAPTQKRQALKRRPVPQGLAQTQQSSATTAS